MGLSIELCKCMQPMHAISALRAEFNPLTTTPLEVHLIDWLEQLLDANAEGGLREYAVKAEQYYLEPDDIEKLGDALIQNTGNTVAILQAIGEAGIDSPELLTAELKLAEQFRALANDAGDFLTRLTDLVTTNQE